MKAPNRVVAIDGAAGPEFERVSRHRERNRRDLSAARPARGPRGPAKESHRRARRAGVVAEVDVVGIRNVLVDAFLDETQAQHVHVEIDAWLHVAGDRSYVVNAGQASGHYSVSLVRARA